MRLQLATFLLMAGTIAACSSNPPPPPPMAMNEPAPAMQAPTPSPATQQPTSGTYRGTAEVTEGGRRCRPMGSVSARVRNNTITVAGLRGRIGSDGAVTGRGLSGNVNGSTADLTLTRGRCNYHMTLNQG